MGRGLHLSIKVIGSPTTKRTFARIECTLAREERTLAREGAFASSRALFPMRGYFEWTGTAGNRQPHFLHSAGGGLLAAAGIYTDRKVDDEWQLSASIITRPARDASGEIHDRMPVFLERDVWDEYLSPDKLDDGGKQDMVQLLTVESDRVAGTITSYDLDRKVNNTRTADPPTPHSSNPSNRLQGFIWVPVDVAALRRDVRSLVLPGQRRIHFTKERDDRKRLILSKLADFGARAHILHCESGSDAASREACLRGLVALAAEHAHTKIVIERDDSIEQSDRRILFREVRKHGLTGTLIYAHEAPHLEPLLWIADAIAWSYTKGGDWKRRIEPLVASIDVVRR